MKNRELKQIIREKALQDMPDVLSRIDINSIDIIPERIPEKRQPFNLSRILSYSLAAIALAIIVVIGSNIMTNDNRTNYTPLETDAQLIGFQAVSAASLLEGVELEELSYSVIPLSETTETDIIASELETIDQYLNMLELTLGDQDAINYEENESDREEYAYLIHFHGTDLVDTEAYYMFYYNQVQMMNRVALSGIFVVGDEEYAIQGSIFSGEVATRSTFRAEIDEDNYVMVNDISTKTQQAFRYRIVKDGVITNESDVQVEMLQGQFRANIQMASQGKQVQLKVQKNQSQGGFDIDFEITNDEVEATGEIEVSLEFDPTLARYIYRYRVFNNQTTETSTYEGYRPPRRTTSEPPLTTETPTTTEPSGSGTTNEDPGTNAPSDNTSPGSSSESPGPTDNPGQEPPGNNDATPSQQHSNI
ncbi:MAG: hypothetical protein JXB20_04590 [Bacilli bacterium]|nr:hypothetical protein [Bacilli bacterium]MBN2696344.1 hypothetical protein [Bacilli bacterium]